MLAAPLRTSVRHTGRSINRADAYDAALTSRLFAGMGPGALI